MKKITQTFLSNIKKHAKTLKIEKNISHVAALELSVQKAGFPSYHALLTRHKKENNHEANIMNANKGFDGVNITYAKAQGDRGKQLNPNQYSSLLVVFDDDLHICKGYEKDTNGKSMLIEKPFQAEYLDKGFAKEVGARDVSHQELKVLCLQAPGGVLGKDFIHDWGYICIEFLKDKNEPWSIEEANKFVKESIGKKIGNVYRDFFYIDGLLMKNHISDEWHRQWDSSEDFDYHPAIDGY